MGIRLRRSNRAEVLLDQLAEAIAAGPSASVNARTPPGDSVRDRVPGPECIAVQGAGMERWVSMRLAERLGVWAQPWFPFPRALAESALDAALGPAEPDAARVFRPDGLTWAIAAQLPSLIEEPAFAPVHHYARGEATGDRALSLAAQLARCFDQYLVYRPEWILRWEQGQGDDFQARLWRAVMTHLPDAHIARRAQRLVEWVEQGGDVRAQDSSFPDRIHLFGLSTLPPLFMRILDVLSTQLEVNLYVLAPCREFAGHLSHADRHTPDAPGMLAGLGKLSRDFQHVLEEECQYEEPAGDLFVDPGTDSLLHGLQSDLLTLTTRPAEEPPLSLSPSDRSVTVHVCHSPTRELEVLRDQIRARLENDPTLRPQDIVVMAADIERYAPAILAVFGADADADDHIPYRVADRGVRATAEVVDALSAVLDLVDSRVSASDVLDLLARPTVRARAGIDEEQLPQLQHWVAESGARWGLDAEHRGQQGQPALSGNTWQSGLDRLLLGYASPSDQRALFAGTLPYDDVEGQQAVTLGRFVAFCDRLFEGVLSLAQPRTLPEWQRDLAALMDGLLAVQPATASQHTRLRDALADMVQSAELVDMQGTVPLRTVRRELEAALERRRGSWGFLAGGVTFCQHVPMRAIPFRLVCMLGMDDESFPRSTRAPGFDRMAEKPRRGDRVARDDDRQVFLEAVLSARDALLISYVGRSVQDDSVRPPSVVVEQLLQLVEASTVQATEDGSLSLFTEDSARDQCTQKHPLQRFSPAYFPARRDHDWFSFDEDARAAAEGLLQPRRQARPFVPDALPERPSQDRELTLDDLIRFFRNPSRALLQQRLGVYLPGDLEDLPDREPMALEGLDGWFVGEALLARCAQGQPLEAEYELLVAQGVLPLGTPGRLAFDRQCQRAQAVLDAVPVQGAADHLLLDQRIGDVRLRGRLDARFVGEGPRGALRLERTFSTVGPRHLLKAWIRHLALGCVAPGEPTLVAGRKGGDATVHRFEPVADAEVQLGELVQLYALGQRTALPFFVDSAWAYVDQRQRKGDAAAEHAARNAFNARQGGDAQDPYVLQVYNDAPPDDPFALGADQAPGFADLAVRVLGPMHAHLEVEGKA